MTSESCCDRNGTRRGWEAEKVVRTVGLLKGRAVGFSMGRHNAPRLHPRHG